MDDHSDEKYCCSFWRAICTLLTAILLGLPGSASFAQQPSPLLPPQVEAPLPPPVELPPGEQTPPMLPNLVQTPPPIPVDLPPLPPECMPNIPDRPLTANEAVLIALHYQIIIAGGAGTGSGGTGKTNPNGLSPGPASIGIHEHHCRPWSGKPRCAMSASTVSRAITPIP